MPVMAIEHRDEDLTGSTFERVDLSGSRLHRVRLRDARVDRMDLTGGDLRNVVMYGGRLTVELADVDINGELENVVINGVEVAPLIEAELARRHPEYGLLKATTADGFREVWPLLEEQWAQTVARARRLEAHDPALLHESVNEEWSVIETLRHMLFVHDSWVRRGLLAEPRPWHPIALPWDQMADTPGVPRDREVRPSLDEVLALRAERQGQVRDYLAGLTDTDLAGSTTPVDAPGWPPPGESLPVREPLLVLLNEEWWHRQFVERDMAVLADRAGIDLSETAPTDERATEGDR